MQRKILLTVILCHVSWAMSDQDGEHAETNPSGPFHKYIQMVENQGKENVNKRYSAFVRIGKSLPEIKRYSSFVRIGKSLPEIKRYSSFVRIGKSQPEDKRYSSFVRIGKSQPTEKRYSSFVRIGKSHPADKRYSSFMRIGKADPNNKRFSSSFVRIGKSMQNGADLMKRLSSFVRIGKMDPEQHKRYSSFVRIGKSIADAQAKRGRTSSFVRIGKSNVGIDDNLLQNYDAHNRDASAFVRYGENGENPQKKYSSFVRIGKRLINDIVPLSLVKTPEEANNILPMQEEQALDKFKPLSRRKRSTDVDVPGKRGFIRIGKIPSSAFMRIGRNPLLDSLMLSKYVREGRRGHSSFIRIGKREVESNLPEGSTLTEDDLRYLLSHSNVILQEPVL